MEFGCSCLLGNSVIATCTHGGALLQFMILSILGLFEDIFALSNYHFKLFNYSSLNCVISNSWFAKYDLSNKCQSCFKVKDIGHHLPADSFYLITCGMCNRKFHPRCQNTRISWIKEWQAKTTGPASQILNLRLAPMGARNPMSCLTHVLLLMSTTGRCLWANKRHCFWLPDP